MISRRVFVAAGACLMLAAGPAAAGDYEQAFPFPQAQVYVALVEALPAVGLKVKAQDALLGRVTASAGMTAFSWGENLSIAVVPNGEAASTLKFDSKRALGTNVVDGGRSLKLFNKVVFEVSRRLQAEAAPAAAPAP